jgi:hypothetical protein
MKQNTYEFDDVRVSVRELLNRDLARRNHIYNRLLESGPDPTSQKWNFARMCCALVALDFPGIDWEPPAEDASAEDIQAKYDAWLDLPIDVGDAVSLAIRGLNDAEKN